MEGSGTQETLMPATTIDPTASSPYTISISTTVSSTADTVTGSILNSQPIMVASFVVELADIAVDLLTLLLLIVVIFLLLRLLHVYRRHKPSETEEGVVNIVQEPVEKAVTHTSDAATQTDAQTLSPVPASPLIGELGVALQKRTRTIKQKSDTAVGTEWLPDLREESLELETQSTSKQEQTQAATPSLDSASLSCRSPVKLSTADKSPKVKPEEEPPVRETEEPEIVSKPLLKTSASAPMLNLKKLSSKNMSKPATGSETLKLPKKKRFILKKTTKDKRYKQKEMENEVAEPVSLEEENPELVMLVRMVRLEGNEEDDEKMTDL